MAQNPSSTRYVIAVDERGESKDRLCLEAAHDPPGTLHRAVSVQLVDRTGRWLLQRRAPAKALFADRWANSCCTHPGPGESLEACARRRVFDELGIAAGPLMPAGWFTYRAVDPVSGLVEHERDHVFVGLVDDTVARPDPGEVVELAWFGLPEASHLLAGPSGAPWAGSVLALASLAFRYGMGGQPHLGEAS
jgi:isopentenyl-diphosphate delta-isomerase